MNHSARNLCTMFAIALLMVSLGNLAAMAQTPSKPPASGQPQTFHVCKMKYALCVWAACEGTQVMGDQATTTCQCPVLTDYSVGAKDCEKDAPTKTTVVSRYSPIEKYARCTSGRPWAMCLDSPCTINSDGTTASCSCSLITQNQGDFMYHPDKPEQCTSGIMSSATVDDLDVITDYLQTQTEMPVFDFTVVNKQKK